LFLAETSSKTDFFPVFLSPLFCFSVEVQCHNLILKERQISIINL